MDGDLPPNLSITQLYTASNGHLSIVYKLSAIDAIPSAIAFNPKAFKINNPNFPTVLYIAIGSFTKAATISSIANLARLANILPHSIPPPPPLNNSSILSGKLVSASNKKLVTSLSIPAKSISAKNDGIFLRKSQIIFNGSITKTLITAFNPATAF